MCHYQLLLEVLSLTRIDVSFSNILDLCKWCLYRQCQSNLVRPFFTSEFMFHFFQSHLLVQQLYKETVARHWKEGNCVLLL